MYPDLRHDALHVKWSLSPEWFAQLRSDVNAWDYRVKQARKSEESVQWDWPNRTHPLKYAGYLAEQVSVAINLAYLR